MSEPTKALLVILGVIVVPLIGYFLFFYLKDYYETKNAIHVTFKKEKGKVKGYVKNKRGDWEHDENLTPEDDLEFEEGDP